LFGIENPENMTLICSKLRSLQVAVENLLTIVFIGFKF